MKIVQKWLFSILFSIMVFPALWAQTSFARGEELFMQNKPHEAQKYLESAVLEDPAHTQAFIYLGIVYLQVNRVDDAIETYRKILPRGGAETARIAYNLGNAYFVKGDAALAMQYYGRAIEADPFYSSAYLNRANSLVKTGELQAAIADYEHYLSLEPASRQREQVQKLITFIQNEFAAEERRRIMAEEAARAEAERRRRLLEEVTDSLQAAADDSRGLSAGSENVQDYDSEFELE